MANNTDRRSFLVAAGTVTTTAVAGCLDSDDDESETDGGELQLVSDAIQTMDPIGVVGADRAWLNWQVHEPLFIHKNGLPPAEGLLAEDYDISGDYLTYTFTLKEGVMFHDGSELTAADVIFSWRRLAESENNRGNANNIVGNVMNISHEEDGDEVVPDSMEIEAVDEYTIEMRLETPFQNVLSHLASLLFSVIPEGVVGDIDGYDGEMDYDEWATEALYGTGPFKLEEWRDGDTVTLTRFDEYHGSVANIDGISAQIIEDSNARYTVAINEQNADLFTIPQAEFNPGLLDVTTELDGNRKEGSYGPADGETLNYGQMSRPRTQYLIFNTLQVDPAARRAIAYAFDQETATAQATDGLGQPAYFLTPPSAFPDGPENYDRIAETEYPYGYNESNLDIAREVMENAGYDEDDPYETTIMYPSDQQASQWEAIVSYLVDLTSSIHIDLSTESAPMGTLINRAIEGNFEIYANYNGLDWLEADATLQFAYPTPNTWTRWGQGQERSEAAQEALEAWERYEQHRVPTSEAQEIRNEVYLTLERGNWEDMTQLPIWHPTEQLYWYDWVNGFEMHGPMRRPMLNEITIGSRD